MKAAELSTSQAATRLIHPDVQRDAEKGMEWLSGKLGKQTLLLMGVPESAVQSPSLEVEKKRVQDFIERQDQLNWMIEHDGKVVGTIWVDLEPAEDLEAPAIHIMIGDASTRGMGVGHASVEAVINFLEGQGHKVIYSRHLSSNEAAGDLLGSFNFMSDGDSYVDKNDLEWQNVIRQRNK